MGFHGPMEAQNLKSVAYRYAASNVTSVSLRDIFKVDNSTSFVCAQGRLSSLIASDGLQNTYQFHLNSIPYPCSNISSVCSNDTDLEWSVPINDTVFNCSDLLSTSDMNVPLFLEELDQPIVQITCDWNKARYARIHQEYAHTRYTPNHRYSQTHTHTHTHTHTPNQILINKINLAWVRAFLWRNARIAPSKVVVPQALSARTCT
jgi:hypothetical protein